MDAVEAKNMDPSETHWQSHRFSILLASLLLFFVAAPVLQLLLSPMLVQLSTFLIFMAVLIAAVFVAGRHPRWRPALMSLALMAALLQAGALMTDSNWMVVGFYSVNFFFMGAIASLTISRLLRSRSANNETLSAAICGYILLILLWANTYSLLDTVTAGSFVYSQANPGVTTIMQFGFGDAMMSLYYSFVTMTTLGYGDVLPVTPMARVLAAMQAFVGQVYIAVLVARLVGLQIAERAGNR